MCHTYLILFLCTYQAPDKGKGSKLITVKMPAIVLMNPEDAGSLLAVPKDSKSRDNAAYWKSRAFIINMGK